MTEDLERRLRRTVFSSPDVNGGRRQVPLNPDGPDAVELLKVKEERIAALEKELARNQQELADIDGVLLRAQGRRPEQWRRMDILLWVRERSDALGRLLEKEQKLEGR